MIRLIRHSTRLPVFVTAGLLACSNSDTPPPPETTASVASALPAASSPSDAQPVAQRPETTLATPRPDTAAAAAPPPTATAPVESSQDKWLSYDAATNTVTFQLIGGTFDFNGYRSGEATLVVPPKANIVMPFVNKDGTPHSAILISGEGPIPNSAMDPAIPRAYTNKVLEGLPQEAGDVMKFQAPESGTYRIFCGVPGHGTSGMWIWMKIDPAAKAPSFGPTKT